jgi:hypothetical protein
MSLECDTGDEATSWCWSWELFSAGPKLGAQLLSQHLIVPLISVMHLAFQSNGLLNELSNIGLEQVGLVHGIERCMILTWLTRLSTRWHEQHAEPWTHMSNR